MDRSEMDLRSIHGKPVNIIILNHFPYLHYYYLSPENCLNSTSWIG